ncbi:hypothetical protein BDV97DRAFT_178817 [Delphinella strobiligena]|nr:hypothetical protein BDV97DRAFT_178817 [Delphinella strobiligena]
MKVSSQAALLVLFSGSVSYGFVNTRCVHPGVRDVLRNECAEFMVTAGSDTYGVRLPNTASQGIATIGNMYDDKRRQADPASADPSQTDFQKRTTMPGVVTVTSTLAHLDVPSEQSLPPTPSQPQNPTIHTQNPTVHKHNPTPPKSSHPSVRTMLFSLNYTSHDPTAPITSTGSMLHSSTSSSSSAAYTQQYPANDNIGPGINNVPIKHIKGEGQGGKKITYPNKKGSGLCKKARKCITIDKVGPIRTCLEDIQAKIHLLAQHNSTLTFAPLQPIACSPAHDSKYCAYVQLVPWQPLKESNERKFQKMNIQPYRGMNYSAVPIGAIKEGVDWIKQGKAKLCGESLLPVPLPVQLDHPEERGKVYTLKIDVNTELPDMDPSLIDAY